jgi:hypothetical protein
MIRSAEGGDEWLIFFSLAAWQAISRSGGLALAPLHGVWDWDISLKTKHIVVTKYHNAKVGQYYTPQLLFNFIVRFLHLRAVSSDVSNPLMRLQIVSHTILLLL